MAKTILAFSGGLASTALLWQLLQRGVNVSCLTVDYGQPNRPELTAAHDLCVAADVDHTVIEIPDLQRRLCGTRGPLPGRNLLVLALAATVAAAGKADTVAYGHTIERLHPEMTFALNHVVQIALGNQVGMYAPYHDHDLERVIRHAGVLGIKVPWHLTWSCYRNGRRHCGECKGCHRRQLGFRCAGVPDPTEYQGGEPVYLPFLRGDL